MRRAANSTDSSANRSAEPASYPQISQIFIHLESRRVSLAGMTRYPGQEWMEQQARNATMEEWGFLSMTGIRSSVRHFVN